MRNGASFAASFAPTMANMSSVGTWNAPACLYATDANDLGRAAGHWGHFAVFRVSFSMLRCMYIDTIYIRSLVSIFVYSNACGRATSTLRMIERARWNHLTYLRLTPTKDIEILHHCTAIDVQQSCCRAASTSTGIIQLKVV